MIGLEWFTAEQRSEVAAVRDRYNRALQAHERRPTSSTSLNLAQAREAYHGLCCDLGVRTPPEVRDPR